MNVFACNCGVVLVAGLTVFTGGAEASQVFPVGDNDGSSLQSVMDMLVVGDSEVKVDKSLDDSLDSLWSIDGEQGIATLIIELAGFATENVFGIYDYNSNGELSYVPLFKGSANSTDKAFVTIEEDGDVVVKYVNKELGFPLGSRSKTYDADFTENSFGFYLNSSHYDAGGIAHSDSSLNEGGLDHMVAYQGVGQEVDYCIWGLDYWTSAHYLLAFEDLFKGNIDWDYNDMVVMVSSVVPNPPSPAPEPATLVLLGAGCAGFGWRMKRRKM